MKNFALILAFILLVGCAEAHAQDQPFEDEATAFARMASREPVTEAEIEEAKTRIAQEIVLATPFPTPEVELGIHDSGRFVEALPPPNLQVVNAWVSRDEAGGLILVRAGQLLPNFKTDPQAEISEHGAIHVSSDEISPTLVSTKEEVGPLRIIEADDLVLTLEAESGALFTFDIMTQTLAMQ